MKKISVNNKLKRVNHILKNLLCFQIYKVVTFLYNNNVNTS